MDWTEEQREAQDQMNLTLKHETRVRIVSAKAQMVGAHAAYGALLPDVDLLGTSPVWLDSMRAVENQMQAARIDLGDAYGYLKMLEASFGDAPRKFLQAEIERRADDE